MQLEVLRFLVFVSSLGWSRSAFSDAKEEIECSPCLSAVSSPDSEDREQAANVRRHAEGEDVHGLRGSLPPPHVRFSILKFFLSRYTLSAL